MPEEPTRFAKVEADDIIDYVERTIRTFGDDGAETEFLKGYLFGLADLHDEFCEPQNWVGQIVSRHCA